MREKDLLVTVGIPTYNRPDGLRRTLECITGQTYQNIEIIVSDNCSPTSDTKFVVQEFMAKDSRIQYYRQEVNRGAPFNFKFVLEKANGEYFMWAADDDLWEPAFVERLVSCLILEPDMAIAMTGVKRIDESGKIFDKSHFQSLVTLGYNQFRLVYSAAGHDMISYEIINYYWYGLFRTAVLRKYANNIDNSFAKDQIIICELLLSVKVGYVDELLHAKHVYAQEYCERYPGEDLGKSYGDPLSYLKLFLTFGPYLIRSSNIPLKRKFWVPLLVIHMGSWVGMLYLNQTYQKIIVSAKKIPVLNRFIKRISDLLNKKR